MDNLALQKINISISLKLALFTNLLNWKLNNTGIWSQNFENLSKYPVRLKILVHSGRVNYVEGGLHMNCCKVICLVIAANVLILITCCGKVSLKNPVVSGFSPANGVVGTQVTISGNRFDPVAGNDSVKFNGVQASIVSAAETQIVAIVPQGATSGPITVTTLNGTSGSPTSFIMLQVLGGSLQGVVPNFANVVSTVAGSAGTPDSTDGTGGAARFDGPFGVTTDGFSVFITDRNNNTIRRMDIATGNVVTIAGTPGVADSIDGTGSSALFNSPSGITTDGTNLYVCDTLNHTIRRIVIATGQVTTIAGLAGVSGSLNGVAGAARFNSPTGITTDGINLYISDTLNNTIRGMALNTGGVTTLAGSGVVGFVDGNSTATQFSAPSGITTDGVNLFIADQGNNAIRKLVLATLQVSTIASSTNGGLNGPSGISTDGVNLYIADTNNQAIRTFIPASGTQSSGQVVTIAGSQKGSADGTGTSARFNFPTGIANTSTSLFIADSANHTIRMLR